LGWADRNNQYPRAGVVSYDFIQWHPTGAWSLSEPVEFANDPLALRQNEFKDFVILSAL